MAHYKISNRVSHLLIFYLLVFDRIHDVSKRDVQELQQKYSPTTLLRFLPPGVGLTGSSRPSKVLLEFKALILKTEHKQTLQSVVMLDCIERILIDREVISHLG